MSEEVNSEIIPLKTKLSFATGMFTTQFYNGVMVTSLAWFWLNIMGIDNYFYSVFMLVVYNIWNAVNDPIFGWISDNTRTKWGRRVPYMRLFSPIWFISHVLLYLPFVDTDIGLVIWFCVVILLFDGCFSFISSCYISLLGEIAFDTKQRTSINTLAMMFGILGNGTAFLGPLIFKENIFAFQTFVVVGGAIALIAMLVPAFIIKERQLPPEDTPLELFTALWTCFKNKPFMSFVIWYFSIEFGSAVIFSALIFYSTFVLGASALEAAILMVFFLLFAAPGFVIFIKLQETYGVRILVMVSTLIIAIGMLLLLFTTEFFQVLLVFGFVGLGSAAPIMFRNVMIMESCDWDELKTNRRREAMYYGTNSLLTKPAIGLAQALLAITLAVTGFRNDTVDSKTGDVIHHSQTAEALLGIRIIMGLIPFLMIVLVGLTAIYFYPSLSETNEMKEKLRLRYKDRKVEEKE